MGGCILFLVDECLFCTCFFEPSSREKPSTSESTFGGVEIGIGGLGNICSCLVTISILQGSCDPGRCGSISMPYLFFISLIGENPKVLGY